MTISLDDILAHHGVKGQKWGVRKDRGHEGERASTRQIAKLDKKYNKSFQGVNGFIKVNNAIATKINPKLDVLNSSPKYKDKNLYDNKKLHDSYFNDYSKILKKSLDEVMVDFGTNASGTKQLQLDRVGFGENTTYEAHLRDVKHDGFPTSFKIKPYLNSKGFITGQTVEPLDETLAQAEGFVDDILEHHGVKGMKWGIRKSRTPSAVVLKATPGRKIKTSGGQFQPASRDAKSAARIRQRAKASSIDSLSNADLKTLVNRMQLERQYSQLKVDRQGFGEKFASAVLKKVGAEQTQTLINLGSDKLNSQVNSATGLKKKK